MNQKQWKIRGGIFILSFFCHIVNCNSKTMDDQTRYKEKKYTIPDYSSRSLRSFPYTPAVKKAAMLLHQDKQVMGSWRAQQTQKNKNGCNVPFDHYSLQNKIPVKREHLADWIPSVIFTQLHFSVISVKSLQFHKAQLLWIMLLLSPQERAFPQHWWNATVKAY